MNVDFFVPRIDGSPVINPDLVDICIIGANPGVGDIEVEDGCYSLAIGKENLRKSVERHLAQVMSIEDQLLQLDNLTPYYKAFIENNLSNFEKVIFDCLSQFVIEVSLKEISAYIGKPSSTIGPILIKLERKRIVTRSERGKYCISREDPYLLRYGIFRFNRKFTRLLRRIPKEYRLSPIDYIIENYGNLIQAPHS